MKSGISKRVKRPRARAGGVVNNAADMGHALQRRMDVVSDCYITACATNYDFSGEPYWDGLIELNVPADDLVRHEILWGIACDYCFSFYLELPVSPINGSVGCPRCGSGKFHRDTLLPIPE